MALRAHIAYIVHAGKQKSDTNKYDYVDVAQQEVGNEHICLY